uniref:Uncharacterized protein n=1 Tax=Vitis vinifera TaxID=29760 RepID=F6H8V6_VITVI
MAFNKSPLSRLKRNLSLQSCFLEVRYSDAFDCKSPDDNALSHAEGEAESKYLSRLGIARQRQEIVDGLKDSVLGFSVHVPGTTTNYVTDLVLVTQHFDTTKEIGAVSKSSVVFIPHGPGAVRDVATQESLKRTRSGHAANSIGVHETGSFRKPLMESMEPENKTRRRSLSSEEDGDKWADLLPDSKGFEAALVAAVPGSATEIGEKTDLE